MKDDIVLDLHALRVSADNSPRIERQMVWLFIGTAEWSLVRIQGLVVRGDHRDWQAAVHALSVASAHIHAKELAALCKRIGDGEDDAASRMGAWLQVREAYDGLVISLRNADLLNRTAQGD